MQFKCECELTCATADVAAAGGATGAVSEGVDDGGGGDAAASTASAASATAPRGVTAPAVALSPAAKPAALATGSSGVGVTTAGAAAAGAGVGAHPVVSVGGGAEGSNGTLGSLALELQNIATSGTLNPRGKQATPLVFLQLFRAAQYRPVTAARASAERLATRAGVHERVSGRCESASLRLARVTRNCSECSVPAVSSFS